MVDSQRFKVNTKGNTDIVDVTPQVAQILGSAGLKQGVATVFVVGSTAGITTIEYEPGLVADMRQMFERLAPQAAQYQHNLRWGDNNGHSHLRASLLGPTLVVPVIDGQLQLGTWQQIVLIDFDVRPRNREIIVQITGE
jgi:secondary thiamine-phosphate synthase enzyme